MQVGAVKQWTNGHAWNWVTLTSQGDVTFWVEPNHDPREGDPIFFNRQDGATPAVTQTSSACSTANGLCLPDAATCAGLHHSTVDDAACPGGVGKDVCCGFGPGSELGEDCKWEHKACTSDADCCAGSCKSGSCSNPCEVEGGATTCTTAAACSAVGATTTTASCAGSMSGSVCCDLSGKDG